MSDTRCDREGAVLAALRTSRLDGELHEHARRCPICRETAPVASALLTLARERDATPLPDPLALLRRARLVAKLFTEKAAVTRAVRRLALAEVFAVLASAMAFVTWALRGALELLQRSLLASGAPWLTSLVSPQSAAAACAIVLLGAGLPLLFALPLLRAED